LENVVGGLRDKLTGNAADTGANLPHVSKSAQEREQGIDATFYTARLAAAIDERICFLPHVPLPTSVASLCVRGQQLARSLNINQWVGIELRRNNVGPLIQHPMQRFIVLDV
jgi:hypothetical protein